MPSTNTLLTPTVIAKVILANVDNHKAMSKHVNTAYKNEFVKVGSTITIRKPNKFRAIYQNARSNTNLSEPSTNMVLDSTLTQVSCAFGAAELASTIEDINSRYLKGMGAAIVNPAANWALADGLKGTFAQNVAKDIITKGFLGQIANLNIYSDQNVVRHTTGHFT